MDHDGLRPDVDNHHRVWKRWKDIAQKAIAIRLDEGPGGVARGSRWVVFEHDTLRMAAVWSGSFLDWNGIQFNGRHGVHLRANGNIHATNSTGPGWANPADHSFDDNQRVQGRDNRKYGPLPAEWENFGDCTDMKTRSF